MAPSYSVEQYLVDRANIHDLVAKSALCYDTRNYTRLANEVLASEITCYYGRPFPIARDKWIKQLKAFLEVWTSTQHEFTGLVVELPQPGPARPDKCIVHTSFQRHRGKGGKVTHDGGKCTFEMVRLPDAEAREGNPWRICGKRMMFEWGQDDAGQDTLSF